MVKKTILNESHRAMGARMVPFGGWDMPVNYGSQIDEHHAVRRDAGMFDVSHMTVVDLHGNAVRAFLSRLLANDVAKLKAPGKALYSCMLNDQGGVIDDLIVYFVDDTWFRLVVNAGTTEKDITWIQRQAGDGVQVMPRFELAMIAVQGPAAREKAAPLLPAALREPALALKPFSAAHEGDWFVGRTGYTGEDGFEIMLPEDQAPALWHTLADAGVTPCGLGARDTLRLEAGMNLYGNDMNEETSPLDAGLSWTVALEPRDRDFIGRSALEKHRAGGTLSAFIGLVLEGQGVLRQHQKVFASDREVGELTSGGFSPTLQQSIGLARVDAESSGPLTVDIRGKRQAVKRVKPPFARHGISCLED